jgi:hypothetical protein
MKLKALDKYYKLEEEEEALLLITQKLKLTMEVCFYIYNIV